MSPPTFEKVSGTYIPDDIVFSILSKLPVKPLQRFACVHKSWSRLFENPIFMNMFRNNLVSKSHSRYDDDDACLIFQWFLDPGKLSFLTDEKFEREIKLDLPPPFDIQQNVLYDHSSILCSAINGILCIYNCINPSEIVLWNPATKEVYAVPPPNLPESLPNVTANYFLHGFGYDHVNDDYKVIRFVHYQKYTCKTPAPFYEIYSLRSHSWRKLDVDIPIAYPVRLDSPVYLDGVCHWLELIDDRTFVVSFNLSNEVFLTTPLDMHGDFGFRLVVLNGSVAIIPYNYGGSTSFSISILGEIGVKESWTRLFDVGLSPSNLYPIAAGKKGNIFFKKQYDKSKLVCFDLATGVIDDIDVEGKGSICDITIYKKNLRRFKE